MNFGEWFHSLTDGLSETQGKLVTTLTLLLIIWLANRIAIRSINQLPSDIAVRYRWRKNATYVIYALGVVSIIFVWSDRFASLATFLGLLSAGLAIAFKDPIANVAGWYYLITNRPYRVGDRIQIGEEKGDVVDISIFRSTLIEVGNWVGADQSTGRVIHIPNSKVFTMAIMNYSELINHIWTEIRVPLTPDSNWQLAKDILQGIIEEFTPKIDESVDKQLEEISEKYLIVSAKLTPIIFTSITDNGSILLTMRYVCMVRQRRQSEHIIYEAILKQLSNHSDIRLAHQLIRVVT
jgi:small-conductance mechanosensitive channel